MMLDALGEVRLTHPMTLIEEILASGTNSVTVTLTDPKVYGEAAFTTALADLSAYDRHIEAHADRLLKATTVADIDRARGRASGAVLPAAELHAFAEGS